MSSIVLTAAVRQNLLALQDTASMMATTQNDLATGKKVNSALDNPTNFFTASGLDNRSSDISNLLDGISNGVQVLQAANSGITSLQSLVSQAKSIANQALQSSIGYSTKSNISTTIPGAISSNLLGTPTYTNATATGTAAANAKTSTTTSATTKLSGGTTSVDGLATALTTSDTLTVNGKTITFNSGSGTTSTASGASIDITTATVATLESAIDAITGAATASTVTAGGALALSTGTASDLTITGSSNALTALGLGTGVTQARTATTPLGGLTLDIAATGGGTATNITFGTNSAAGQVQTLDQLNSALSANNLQATLDSAGVLTISTTNDDASATGGAVTGTATGAGKLFSGKSFAAPVADPTSQATRANLVSQYNAILTQITNTAQDSSYNGINLLAGDQLQLTFNETGKSKVDITGTDFSAAGLGLSNLVQGTAFIDNASTNNVLSTLNTVSSNLRAQASAFGSNLSVVQTRQDFNKSLINVLQTGSANLTQADINEEAANSQALSTRQSLSVSALSLANQAQQSVLQLLR